MESKKNAFNDPHKNRGLEETFTKTNLMGIYPEHEYVHLNVFKLFAASFHTIPNFRFEKNINCAKATDWFKTTYQAFIQVERNVQMDPVTPSKRKVFEVFCFLYEDLIVHIDPGWSRVEFIFQKTALEKVEDMISGFKKFRKRKERFKPEISLLIQTRSSIEISTFDILKPKLRIEDNYNDDLREFHEVTLKRLSKKNDKGLVLLHGKPGTGKTSYIRHLISSIKKDVIFLPINTASVITTPGLISILVNNPNSIFVIEDAENMIIDREAENNSPVSVLLNISDGLLSDCVNIQIICSFNTDLSKVDDALMRKGRLIGRYEFRELETEKAQRLSDKLGFSTEITRPMTLTEIYNQEEKQHEPLERNSYIGFKSVSFN